MAKLMTTVVLLALATTVAGAQAQQQNAQRQAGPAAQILPSVPSNSNTVTNWYKQDVYDPNNNKIGQISDVLVDKSGKISTLIIGVGGFLGAGEKDVAVPFNAVRVTSKNNNNSSSNKWYLVMNSSKDALKNAKGFKYDRNAMTWVPEGAPTTTGSPNAR